jgi:PBSX family phage terminase large subunit
VEIVGANDERSQEKIRGRTVAGAYGDEITLWPESFWKMLLSRLSVKGAQFFGTTNPDSPYHYLKTEYLDRAGELDLKRFHFELSDNPNLDPSYVEALRKEYTGLWYDRFIKGMWVQAEGAVYDMWNPEIHVVNTRKILGKGRGISAGEKRTRMAFRGFWRYFVACDYGTNNPCVFGLFAYREGSPAYLVKEWHYDGRATGKQKTDGEYRKAMEEFVKGYDILKIYVDPSASSFITELKKSFGNKVTPAKNDVVDGIRFVSGLLSEGGFFIDEGCTETAAEFSGYVWDAKAQRRGEDVPMKVNDHCFVSDTQIETRDGFKNISDIVVGDYVLTRYGYRKVIDSQCTGFKDVYEFQIDDVTTVTSTDSHNIITTSGKKPISEIGPGDTLFIKEDGECHKKSLNMAGENTTCSKTATTGLSQKTAKAPFTFIGKCGETITALSQKALKFITKMATKTITPLKTLSVLTGRFIGQIMPKSIMRKIKKLSGGIWRKSDRLPPNGTELTRDASFLKTTWKKRGLAQKIKSWFASNAANRSQPGSFTTMPNFAPTNANQHSGEQTALTMKPELVVNVAKSSESINTIKPYVVQNPVRQNFVGKKDVYNLTVEEHHEYFANGLLVSNCMDMVRYGLFTHFYKEAPGFLAGFNYK